MSLLKSYGVLESGYLCLVVLNARDEMLAGLAETDDGFSSLKGSLRWADEIITRISDLHDMSVVHGSIAEEVFGLSHALQVHMLNLEGATACASGRTRGCAALNCSYCGA